MIDANSVPPTATADERYVVPLKINEDYTYESDQQRNLVELVVEQGPYSGLIVQLPADSLEFASPAGDDRPNQFQYRYTIVRLWDQIDEEKVAGNQVTLDTEDQTFLHSLVFSFYDNIRQGQVQGLSLLPNSR